jgi:hypothetical protein
VVKIDINTLKNLILDEDNVFMTAHVSGRCEKRGITADDIVNAIQSGEIIEDYPDDYPYPSVLVLGKAIDNRNLHTVVGVGNGKLWIITAYFPNTDKWENDFKTRKAVK